MLKAKDKAVTGLTKGVEFLFKKYKVREGMAKRSLLGLVTHTWRLYF